MELVVTELVPALVVPGFREAVAQADSHQARATKYPDAADLRVCFVKHPCLLQC